MIPAPIPADEAARLKALRQLLVLDTPPEARYDRIVAFAATEFDVPMALISLVDEGRQWFKASVGLQVLPEDHPLCGGCGTDNRVAIYSDRYDEQPLVVQGPGAGAGITAAALLDDVLAIATAR